MKSDQTKHYVSKPRYTQVFQPQPVFTHYLNKLNMRLTYNVCSLLLPVMIRNHVLAMTTIQLHEHSHMDVYLTYLLQIFIVEGGGLVIHHFVFMLVSLLLTTIHLHKTFLCGYILNILLQSFIVDRAGLVTHYFVYLSHNPFIVNIEC